MAVNFGASKPANHLWRGVFFKYMNLESIF